MRLLDEIFPPLCLCCKEFGEKKWFCSSCWELLSLPNPKEKCRHCFANSPNLLCDICRQRPLLELPRAVVFESSLPASILRGKVKEAEEALTSIAFIFFQKLEWSIPDLIIPVPDERGEKSVRRMAKFFAALMGKPSVQFFNRTYRGFLQPDLVVSALSLEANQTVLLFDVSSSLSWLKKASDGVLDVFPKKAMILSLFGE